MRGENKEGRISVVLRHRNNPIRAGDRYRVGRNVDFFEFGGC